MNYYVYYRVEVEADAWHPRVRAMQSTLEERSGIRGELMVSATEPRTWMEVYEGVQNISAFEAALERAVREFRLEEDLLPESRRMLERFEPL